MMNTNQINQNDPPQTNRIPYRVYDYEDLKIDDEKHEVIEFEYTSKRAFLVVRRNFCEMVHHVAFHARDHQWVNLTETGYHSFFINNDPSEPLTTTQVVRWFQDICDETFDDVEKQQLSIF